MVVNLSEETAAVVDDHYLKLSGDLVIDNISRLYSSGFKTLKTPIYEVDLSMVKTADSACLALLLFLQNRIDGILKIHALPDDLKVLVDLYDLEKEFQFLS